LLWVRNAPILRSDNKEEYTEFVDNIVKCELPDKENNPSLYKLVSTFQTHSHSKSCRKYKNKNCRYSFGKYFTDHTIVAEPLPDNISKEEKEINLNNRKTVLNTFFMTLSCADLGWNELVEIEYLIRHTLSLQQLKAHTKQTQMKYEEKCF